MNLQKESIRSKGGCSREVTIYLSMRGAYPAVRRGKHYFMGRDPVKLAKRAKY